MSSLYNYSLFGMLAECGRNKDLIESFLSGKEGYKKKVRKSRNVKDKTVESYEDEHDYQEDNIVGLGTGIFLIILLFRILFLFLSIAILLTEGKQLQQWAAISAIAFLFIGSPFISWLILSFSARKTSNNLFLSTSNV